MNKKLKFYSLNAILEKHAHYNIIIGERSNGKTTAVLRYALEHYIKTGKQVAYIRRWDEDLKGGRGASIWSGIIALGWLEELTHGEYTEIVYRGRAWYLANPDPNEEGKYITQNAPFAYAFSLTKQESYKSISYPNIDTIVFEEFLSRQGYLTDEFIIFMNLLSTIIRERADVKIFMLGNTVNKYSPYFAEMGLTHIKEMDKGTIDVYNYGASELRVAVEFADFPSKQKPSDIYFAFNNPRLNMITGQGQVWEMAIYPHLPEKYAPKDVLFTYFVQFDGETLQAEIISKPDCAFTYIHRKTTPIKDEQRDIIFSPDCKPSPNYRRRINTPPDKLGRRIWDFFVFEKVYYQDNNCGEIMRNYIQFCNN